MGLKAGAGAVAKQIPFPLSTPVDLLIGGLRLPAPLGLDGDNAFRFLSVSHIVQAAIGGNDLQIEQAAEGARDVEIRADKQVLTIGRKGRAAEARRDCAVRWP